MADQTFSRLKLRKWPSQSQQSWENRTPEGRPIPGLAKNSRCCGKVNDDTKPGRVHGTRIVNGTATRRGEFPWMAAVVHADGEYRNGFPFCGGALINDRYVLTAAHCVSWWPSAQWGQVILGRYETTQSSSAELRLGVDQVIVHPNWNVTYAENDIALLKLNTVLDLPTKDNSMAPICLPTRRMLHNELAELAGWGILRFGGNLSDPIDRPVALAKLQLRIVNNGVCGWLNRPELNQFPFLVRPSNVCALGTIGDTGACRGDSGSPLIVAARFRRSRRTVVGITSWGIGCAGSLFPGVYTRVSWFLDWIVANTQDAHYC